MTKSTILYYNRTMKQYEKQKSIKGKVNFILWIFQIDL